MSVYIRGMACRAGAARGSQGSSASNRGGERYEAGLAEGLPEESGYGTRRGESGGIAGVQVGEKGPGRALYGAGCGSVAAAAGGGEGGGAGGGGGLRGAVCRGVCMSVQELSYCLCLPCCCTVLLQHGADPNIRNTDGKSALDLAEPSAKAVLTGQFSFLQYKCVSLCSHRTCPQFSCLSVFSTEAALLCPDSHFVHNFKTAGCG